MAADVDVVVQQLHAAGEAHVAAGVADRADGAVEPGQGARGRGAAAVDDQVAGRQVGDIAGQRPAVGQRAQRAGRGDVQRRRAGHRAGVVKGIQAGADIVVGGRRQQVAATDHGIGTEAGDAAGDRGPGIVGAGATLDQGDAVARQVVAYRADAGVDHTARHGGSTTDGQHMTAGGQRAAALSEVARNRHVGCQGDAGTGIADRVRRHVDGVAQADRTGREHHVGARVGDGAAGEAAHGPVAAAVDGEIPGRLVHHVADEDAAVGQVAQGAGAGDVQCRGATGRVGQGPRDVQRGQAGADVIVARHGQQVAAAGAAVGRQAGQAADHRRAGIVGTSPTLDQDDAVTHQVIGRPVQAAVDHAAGDAGGVADGQHMTAQAQGARRLAVGPRDTDVAGQADAGARVGHRMTGGDDGIAQADGARREHHIAAGIADGAAGEHTHRAVGATGDAEIARRQVGDIARDGAAVGQAAQGAGAGDVQRRGAAGRIGQGAGDTERGQAGTDVVVARDRQQIAAAGGAGGVQAGQAAHHRGPAVVGTRPALDQGDAIAHQVVGRPVQAAIDHAAADAGRVADGQHMTTQAQRARRLAVGAADADVAGEGDGGTGVGHRVAGGVDVVAQADRPASEGQVAQAVADGAAAEAAHRAVATTHDHQVVGAGVDHVADDGPAVGQGAQTAGAGDQHRRGGVDRPAVAQRPQRATDIVAEQRQQQVGGRAVGARAQRGAEARGRGTEAAGGQRPTHLGDGVALAGDQVAARKRRHRHRAAGEGGVAADQQFTRRAAADAHGQGARRLAVVARHADGVGQQHVGAAVHQRTAAHVHLVVQQQVARRQFHVAAGAGDGADGTVPARQGAGHGSGAAGEHQGAGNGVQHVAGDGAAIGDGADAALVAQRRNAGDEAAVADAADGAAVVEGRADGVGLGDQAAVVDTGDAAAVVQAIVGVADGALVDDGADLAAVAQAGGDADTVIVGRGAQHTGVDDRADAGQVVQAHLPHGRAAVGHQADGAGVADAIERAGQQAAVGQGADAAARGDEHRRIHRRPGDGAGVVQAGQRAADIVVGRDQQQVDVAAHRAVVGRDGRAEDAGADDGPGVVGPGTTLDQGAIGAAHQVVAGRAQLAGGDGAAGDVGHTADRRRLRPQAQRAAGLGEVAGDVQRAAQRQGGAAVHHRVGADIDGIAQGDGAGGEGQVAVGVADGTAGEGAHRGAAAADDDQVVGAVVHHVADDGAAVGQRAQAAVAGDADRRGGVDDAGVGDRAQRAADVIAEQGQQQILGAAVGGGTQGGAEAADLGGQAGSSQGAAAGLDDGVALARQQVGAVQRRHGHRAPRQGGGTADQQLTGDGTAHAHGQGAGGLEEVPRDAENVG
ncbi:Major ampullate spidroin 1 [Nitrospirillum viridazoti Y2]|nr:Major ampullate spidroin 1 [Nitrospirillum amazonense Y2]